MNETTLIASTRRRLMPMIAVVLACAFLPACASFPEATAAHADTTQATHAVPPPGTSNPPSTAAAPANDGSDSSPGSNAAANLQRLIDSHQLTELRTTYSASYGTSLLFQTDKLVYYIALFRNKQFWRVIQTDSYETAENTYNTFVKQTRDLAQVEIDATRLQAGKAYAERMITLNQKRLQNLEQDKGYQEQQAKQVVAAQEQAKQQAVSLSEDLNSTSKQLDAMKQNIEALEKQQANPTLLLPTSSASNNSPPAQTPVPNTPQNSGG